jgi:hypothetical protein
MKKKYSVIDEPTDDGLNTLKNIPIVFRDADPLFAANPVS